MNPYDVPTRIKIVELCFKYGFVAATQRAFRRELLRRDAPCRHTIHPYTWQTCPGRPSQWCRERPHNGSPGLPNQWCLSAYINRFLVCQPGPPTEVKYSYTSRVLLHKPIPCAPAGFSYTSWFFLHKHRWTWNIFFEKRK